MLDKKLIQTMYDHRFTYAEIGRRLGVSRQRIHQILSGYKTNTVKIKTRRKLINKPCEICGHKPDVIHHIDKNPDNNEVNNLMPLCYKCHVEVHRGSTHRTHGITMEKYICKECGKTFERPKTSNNKKLYCSKDCFSKARKKVI